MGLEPECQILVSTWSFGPLKKELRLKGPVGSLQSSFRASEGTNSEDPAASVLPEGFQPQAGGDFEVCYMVASAYIHICLFIYLNIYADLIEGGFSTVGFSLAPTQLFVRPAAYCKAQRLQ